MSRHIHSGFDIPVGSKYRPPRGAKLGYNVQNLVGKTSGHLTVQSATESPTRLHCVCTCGGTRTVEMYVWNRKKGGATSCGSTCPIAHPPGVVKGPHNSTKKKTAQQWAESLKPVLEARIVWSGMPAIILVEGSGFRVASSQRPPGRGRKTVPRSQDEIVGCYAAGVPLEYLVEDLQVALDAREIARGTSGGVQKK